MGQLTITGARLTPLAVIPGDAGSVMHGLKSSELSFMGFGEAYFSTVKKGSIKGWKKHREMFVNLVVPVGRVRVALFDDRPGSKTKMDTVYLSPREYARLTIPPGVFFAFQGLEAENILLNIASIPHSDEEVTTIDLKRIEYDWGTP